PTSPLQSKPAVVVPPQRYGVPSRASARLSTLWMRAGSGASWSLAFGVTAAAGAVAAGAGDAGLAAAVFAAGLAGMAAAAGAAGGSAGRAAAAGTAGADTAAGTTAAMALACRAVAVPPVEAASWASAGEAARASRQNRRQEPGREARRPVRWSGFVTRCRLW